MTPSNRQEGRPEDEWRENAGAVRQEQEAHLLAIDGQYLTHIAMPTHELSIMYLWQINLISDERVPFHEQMRYTVHVVASDAQRAGEMAITLGPRVQVESCKRLQRADLVDGVAVETQQLRGLSATWTVAP